MTSALVHTLDTYGDHFNRMLHVPDKRWAETAMTEEVRTLIVEAINFSTYALIFGRQGRGKSAAVGMALRELLPGTGIEPILLQCRFPLHGRSLLEDLYSQLLGVEPRKGLRIYQLVASLRRSLAEEQRFVVIDDAQLANSSAILTMALLCAESDTTFGLIVIGTPDLKKRLRPEVLSRGTGEYWATSLSDADVVEVLCDVHPLFATADPADLREWNRTHASGEFRNWARTLGRAWDLRHETGGVLNRELFEMATYNAPRGIRDTAE